MNQVASAKLPPGPKGNLFFNRDFDIRNNVLEYLVENTKLYPDIYRIKAGFVHIVNITEPSYIEHVLGNSELYDKGDDNKNMMLLLGKGLLTSEGSFWKKQRRLIQPIFHKRRLDGFVGKIAESVRTMLTEWEQKMDGTLNMHAEMTRIALSVVSKTLMNTDAGNDAAKVNEALTGAMDELGKRSMNPLKVPYWVPIPLHNRLRRQRKILDELIFGIIEDRRKHKKQEDDLLSMLMEVEDADTAERMSNEQLRDEVFTIFTAGFETTANALSFALYLLALHPEVKAKVAEEARQVLQGADITFEHIPRLEYTMRVIKETMRLYPPAWILGRQATRDDIIDGYLIKKNDRISLSPYAMHHHAKYWPEPEKFDPDRFLPEGFKQQHRYAYYPFGGGARLCIGNNFAMMEMQIVLAMTCLNFDLKVAEGFTLGLDTLITLRPKNGVMIKVQKAREMNCR
jgi:cytochrome P450